MTAVSESELSIEIDGRLATVRLMRPEKRNALHLDLVHRIGAFFAQPPPRSERRFCSVRVIISVPVSIWRRVGIRRSLRRSRHRRLGTRRSTSSSRAGSRW
jgi:hypothetical protein